MTSSPECLNVSKCVQVVVEAQVGEECANMSSPYRPGTCETQSSHLCLSLKPLSIPSCLVPIVHKCFKREVELCDRCPCRSPKRLTKLLYPNKWSNLPSLSPATITGCPKDGDFSRAIHEGLTVVRDMVFQRPDEGQKGGVTMCTLKLALNLIPELDLRLVEKSFEP